MTDVSVENLEMPLNGSASVMLRVATSLYFKTGMENLLQIMKYSECRACFAAFVLY